MIDKTDKRILAVLQQDGRISNQQLAEQVGISPAASWRRLKALTDEGVVRRYTALVDPKKAGFELCVFLQISLSSHSRDAMHTFEDAVRNRPEVLECYAVAGDPDFLLRVVIEDMETYDRFLEDFLFTLPAIGHVKSNFALREIKFDTSLPIQIV